MLRIAVLLSEPRPCLSCSASEHDYLYGAELEALQADGTLTHLFTAFSREHPGRKVYVQDRIREQGRLVASLVVDKRAIFYVCG